MALSSDNDSITLSNYKIEYNLDYYTNKFSAGDLVDLFQICELNFNTDTSYHRFRDSIVYTTLSNYKVQNSYNLNNRLVKKSASTVFKFQPTVNSSSFKIAGKSAQFLVKGFSPRPINISTDYSVDGPFHYGQKTTDESVYQASTNLKNYYSRRYASSILNHYSSDTIFIWRKNQSIGCAYASGSDIIMDGISLCVLTPRYTDTSTLYLPTNYQSQMPYVMTCILGGAGGGGSSGVDVYNFPGILGAINNGYSRHSIYGGAGGGSGATLIMNLSFGTDTHPVGYLIKIGAGGAGGASAGDDATKDGRNGRGVMNAGTAGGASYIYAYQYNGQNSDKQDVWEMKEVNGSYTYFAHAGGGGGGKAISSTEAQPSYAEEGIAGTYSSVAQEYFQVIASFDGAKGGHGGCEPGSSDNDRYSAEKDLRASSLEYPAASGDDIMLAVSHDQSSLGYVSFKTMEGLTSSKINFPSHWGNHISYGTLISHRYVDGTECVGAAGGGGSSLLAVGGLGRAWQNPDDGYGYADGSLGSGGGGGDFGTGGGYRGGHGGDGYVIICY